MQPGEPAIDVVVLSWNRVEQTLECLGSVGEQEAVRPRVWIVDQGSDRDQLSQVERAVADKPWVHLEKLPENVGVPAGRNLGMSLGKAPYLAVLDNDASLAQPDELAKVVQRFEAEPELGAIGFQIRSPRTGRVEWMTWGYPRALWERRHESFLTTRFVGAGHALRREALERTAGYDETLYFVWEELDLSYQLIAAGYRIRYDPSIVVLHRAALEQRHYWGGERFYYHVRNGLYVRFKHLRSTRSLLAYSFGYLIKGVYNALPRQALRGVRDGLRMIRGLPHVRTALGPEARRYLREHDGRYRGGLVRRLRDEVLERLID